MFKNVNSHLRLLNKLQLKKCDKVILLVNLDIKNGLANGTQLLVLETHEEYIY